MSERPGSTVASELPGRSFVPRIKSFKFRIYPTIEQIATLEHPSW